MAGLSTNRQMPESNCRLTYSQDKDHQYALNTHLCCKMYKIIWQYICLSEELLGYHEELLPFEDVSCQPGHTQQRIRHTPNNNHSRMLFLNMQIYAGCCARTLNNDRIMGNPSSVNDRHEIKIQTSLLQYNAFTFINKQAHSMLGTSWNWLNVLLWMTKLSR